MCDGCLTYAISKTVPKANLPPTPTNEKKLNSSVLSISEPAIDLRQDIVAGSNNDSLIDKVVSLIKQKSLTEEQLAKLSGALGENVSQSVYERTENLKGQYRNLEETSSLDCLTYIQSKPEVVVRFVCGAANIDYQNLNSDPKKLHSLCILIEHLEHLRNSHYVGRLSFSTALVKWNFSGSKASHTLSSACSAAGSITTMKDVFKERAMKENICEVAHDIEIFSDNTQKKGRTTRVKEDATCPIGIATNVVIIHSNFKSNYQQNSVLSPDTWLYSANDDSIADKVKDYENNLNENIFRPYRGKYQGIILKDLISEVQFDINGSVCDNVSISQNLDDENKLVCPKCSSVGKNSHKLCLYCNYDLRNFPARNLIYNDVPNGHPDIPPDIELGEVIDCNPSGYEALYVVLEDLLRQAGIGVLRKWVRIGFDGVPARMALELILAIVKCKDCGEIFDQFHVSKEDHFKTVHPAKQFSEDSFFLYFGKLLVTIGAGHMEKNILLAIMKISKPLFMDIACDVLGFKSENAKNFVTNVGDHHVSWQAFTITLEAFARELMVPYIISAHERGIPPTVMDFYIWKAGVVNPNYNFYYDLVFNVMLGLKCYRSGVRRNSSKHLIAGRQKAATIMFFDKHDIYRPILVHDMKLRVLAPDQISTYISQNESFSRSGDQFRGEGGDYVTETENKHLKANLPPGVPNFATWQMASRNHKVLLDNRQSVYTKCCLVDPRTQKSSVFNFAMEIQAFRRIIRESKIFDKPMKAMPLTNLKGELLHPSLVNFCFTARENYHAYLDDPESELKPVFISYEDEENFNDPKNWKIAKIDLEIQKLLDTGNLNECEKITAQDSFKKVKNQNKCYHLELLEELKRLGQGKEDNDIES